MYDAYQRIFTRCGLAFRAVEADTGAIGGSMSHEFQVLAETGEDALVACDTCDYAANVEQAEAGCPSGASTERRHCPSSTETMDKVATPGKGTHRGGVGVPRAAAGRSSSRRWSTWPTASRWLVLVRGDRDLNEIKLKQARSAPTSWCWRATRSCEEVTGAPVGFAGPVGLEGAPSTATCEVARMPSTSWCGANEADVHLRTS